MNITLALNGGGVKRFTHTGVLRVLEQEGFQISGIAWPSAGGLVGAVCKAGNSAHANESNHINNDREFCLPACSRMARYRQVLQVDLPFSRRIASLFYPE